MRYIKLNDAALAKYKSMSNRNPLCRKFIEVALRPLFGLKRLQAFEQLRRGRTMRAPDCVWTDTMAYFFVEEAPPRTAPGDPPVEITKEPVYVPTTNIPKLAPALRERLDEIQKRVPPPFVDRDNA